MEALESLRWRCHICGADRPDDKISVAKHKHVDGYGFEWGENVRYCNDKESCTSLAKQMGLSQLEAHRQRTVLERELAQLRDRVVVISSGGVAFGVLCGLFLGYLLFGVA